jgi:hypothetical protein
MDTVVVQQQLLRQKFSTHLQGPVEQIIDRQHAGRQLQRRAGQRLVMQCLQRLLLLRPVALPLTQEKNTTPVNASAVSPGRGRKR